MQIIDLLIKTLAPVGIFAEDIALADGLATTLMVLDKNDALDLTDSLTGCEAYMVDKNLKHFNTSGFFS